MTTSKARKLAGDWHGGQTSALYSFASTGEIHFDYWSYSREINRCLTEVGLDRKKRGQLLSLLLWFDEHCPPDEDEDEDEEEDEEDEPTLHECNCGFSTENEYDWDEHECSFTRGRPV